jgi:hypothetical protein
MHLQSILSGGPELGSPTDCLGELAGSLASQGLPEFQHQGNVRGKKVKVKVKSERKKK